MTGFKKSLLSTSIISFADYMGAYKYMFVWSPYNSIHILTNYLQLHESVF